MSITEITLYNILRKKFGEEETAKLVEFVKSEVQNEINNRTERFATKEDMERGFKDQLKWIIILIFGQSALLITIMKLL
ncbi:MAG TPA: hypothetical protein PL009_00890 [Flavipsychrobacter sp.]|nr:hypothetical protein [Flavipsychrobacter sp.]